MNLCFKSKKELPKWSDEELNFLRIRITKLLTNQIHSALKQGFPYWGMEDSPPQWPKICSFPHWVFEWRS